MLCFASLAHHIFRWLASTFASSVSILPRLPCSMGGSRGRGLRLLRHQRGATRGSLSMGAADWLINKAVGSLGAAGGLMVPTVGSLRTAGGCIVPARCQNQEAVGSSGQLTAGAMSARRAAAAPGPPPLPVAFATLMPTLFSYLTTLKLMPTGTRSTSWISSMVLASAPSRGTAQTVHAIFGTIYRPLPCQAHLMLYR